MKRDTPARPAPTGSASSRSTRLRDAAVVLPLLGLFAWMPPVIGLFAASRQVLGVPLIVAWLFGVWLALIVVAFWFSRRLDDEAAETADDRAGAHAHEAEPYER